MRQKIEIRRDRGENAAKNGIRRDGSENVTENEIRRDGSENVAEKEIRRDGSENAAENGNKAGRRGECGIKLKQVGNRFGEKICNKWRAGKGSERDGSGRKCLKTGERTGKGDCHNSVINFAEKA